MRHCSSCGIDQPDEQFHITRKATTTRSEQRRRECKSCTAANMRERRKAIVPRVETTRHCSGSGCGVERPLSEFRRYGTHGHARTCDRHTTATITPHEATIRRYPLNGNRARRDRPMIRSLEAPPASSYWVTCPTCRAAPGRPCDASVGSSHHPRLYRWARIVTHWPNLGRERI